MSTVEQEIEYLSWRDVYRYTQSGGKIFAYESPFEWDQSHLVEYNAIEDAEYPPVTFTYRAGTIDHYFPSYDMLVRDKSGKARVLFTGAHNGLLYHCREAKLGVAPNAKRVLINQDDHDDILLGRESEHEIHIGNWVSHGYNEGFWGRYAHLSNSYTPSIYQLLRPKNYAIPYGLARGLMPTVSLSSWCNPDFLKSIFKEYMESLNGDPFIFTLDADDLADWTRSFGQDGQELLEIILDVVLSQPNLELFHFTPSPAYCPHEEAKKVWDFARNIYLQKFQHGN